MFVSRGEDSNPQPSLYKSVAQPLSYLGAPEIISFLRFILKLINFFLRNDPALRNPVIFLDNPGGKAGLLSKERLHLAPSSGFTRNPYKHSGQESLPTSLLTGSYIFYQVRSRDRMAIFLSFDRYKKSGIISKYLSCLGSSVGRACPW